MMVGESHESVRWSCYSPGPVFVFSALSAFVCAVTAQYLKEHLVCVFKKKKVFRLISQYNNDTTERCIINICKHTGLLNAEFKNHILY